VLCFSTCSLQSWALDAYQKAQFLFDMATCGVQGFWKKGNHCKSFVCFALINFKAFCVLVDIQICQLGGWVRSDPSLSFTISRDFASLFSCLHPWDWQLLQDAKKEIDLLMGLKFFKNNNSWLTFHDVQGMAESWVEGGDEWESQFQDFIQRSSVAWVVPKQQQHWQTEFQQPKFTDS